MTQSAEIHECRKCPQRPGGKWRTFATAKALSDHDRAKHQAKAQKSRAYPDFAAKCMVCESPFGVIPETGMCGPCTTGEASTLGEF